MAKRSGLISHGFLPGSFFLAFVRHLNSPLLGGDELLLENHKKILFLCQEENSDLVLFLKNKVVFMQPCSSRDGLLRRAPLAQDEPSRLCRRIMMDSNTIFIF